MAEEAPAVPRKRYEIATRYRTRQKANNESTPSILTSPTSQLDEYFPPRKAQRLVTKNAKDAFRHARQRAKATEAPLLTGYLGTLPREVRQFGG